MGERSGEWFQDVYVVLGQMVPVVALAQDR